MGTLLFLAVIIAILANVEVYHLSGSGALADDGLARGKAAPAWSLADQAGQPVESPPVTALYQLILFSDHSLTSFPSVAEGLRTLAAADPRPEIVILTRQPGNLTGPAMAALGLADLPVVTGSPALYGRYNVRAMPFMIFVDRAGQVRASSLVNHAWQVGKLWRLAQVDPVPGEERPARRHGRLAGSGV